MNISRRDSNIHSSSERRIIFIAVFAIILGFLGFQISGHGLASYIFAHVGALGVLSLSGSLSGCMARRKGYGYWSAYFWGFAFPAIIGVISVVVVHALGGGGCGGIVSIAAALVVIIILLKRKNLKSPTKEE